MQFKIYNLPKEALLVLFIQHAVHHPLWSLCSVFRGVYLNNLTYKEMCQVLLYSPLHHHNLS